jgi:DNA-binding NtrC family response regulator
MPFGGYAVAIVLIVEDEDQVRVLAESFLQGEGHTTLSAATVDQAVALLESEDPIDVLFADVTIQDDPEAGLALANKAVERRPELKVLYTSDQGVTDGMQALFVKNSAFLPKPYTVDQLTEFCWSPVRWHQPKIRTLKCRWGGSRRNSDPITPTDGPNDPPFGQCVPVRKARQPVARQVWAC